MEKELYARLLELVKTKMPDLHRGLKEVLKNSQSHASASPELCALIMAFDADYQHLLEWAGLKQIQNGEDRELSNEEAMMVMAEADEADLNSRNTAHTANEEQKELTDEDARRLLDLMDAPANAATEAANMDDDEARRLLEAMDAPSGKSDAIDDDEARRMLEEMDAPAAKETAPSAPAPKIVS